MKLKKKYCIIEASELARLLALSWELETLFASGVDNWSWYGMDFAQSIEELCDAFGFEYKEELNFSDVAEMWIENKAVFMGE